MRILIICLIVFLYEIHSQDKFPNFKGGKLNERSEHKEETSCFKYKKEDNKISVNLCNKDYRCPIEWYLPLEDINVECIPKDLTGNSIDGESCKDPKDCASGVCSDEGKCVGFSEGSECVDHL